MTDIPKLLYKTGESQENYSRLLVNKWGNEEWISKFFEKHLENIFPNLELFVFDRNGKKTTEWSFGKGRLDAISWYQQEKTLS